MMIIFERDQERRKTNRVMVDARFELFYTKWNTILQESGGPYVLGKKLTHADFWLASFINIWDDPMVDFCFLKKTKVEHFLKHLIFQEGDGPIMPPGFSPPSPSDMYPDFTKNFPSLRAHKERICSLPEIQAWIKKRHQTIA
jgi:glutathione S-transferase